MMKHLTFLRSAGCAAVLLVALQAAPAAAQTLSAAPGIPVSGAELKEAFASLLDRCPGETEIFIYEYDSPKEVYTLQSDETLTLRTEPGKLSALVRIPGKGKNQKTLFAEGAGFDTGQMLSALRDSISDLLPH